MIIMLFLMSIDQQVAKASGSNKPQRPVFMRSHLRPGQGYSPKYGAGSNKEAFEKKIEKPYAALKEDLQKKATPTFGQKVKATINNAKNIAVNAFDNSAGYGIAKYQNYQNMGSQWRLARQARKDGKIAYHLNGNHGKGLDQSVDLAFNQIEAMHKKTKLKDAEKRNDIYTGHSSGANVGLYLATDERIKKYGISHVQARAPTPTGFKVKTLGQKLITPFMDIKSEDITGEEGRRNVLKLHARGKPHVPVYIIAGKYDNLVTPDLAAYKHAKGMHVIDHKDSTHFGTSGVNSVMNQVFLDLMNNTQKYASIKKYFKPEYATLH
jgi:hypothetical protein